MARIIIRGRREPIEIENERAQKVKNKWLGLNGVERVDKFDLVDLGEWSGEYGKISEIEMTSFVDPNKEDEAKKKREAEEAAEKEAWLKLKPEEKAKHLGKFRLAYSVRTGDFKTMPPEDVMKKAEKLALAFFKKNPTALYVTNDIFAELLPKQKGETLSEKMAMPDEKKPNGRKCLKCKKPLTGNLIEYCSGKCKLEAENG